MAKRLIDWSLKRSILVMGKYIDADTPAETLAKFGILELYPKFMEFNPAQKFFVVYGIKQKLADCGSGTKDAVEKSVLAVAKFKEFVDAKDGELIFTRSNGTGAKAAKAFHSDITARTKVISYDGLMLKKLTFKDTFTAEDEAKLQEFENIKMKHLMEQMKQSDKNKPQPVKPKK